MPYFFDKTNAEVVRIEGDAPRTLYTCIEPNTAQTERFAMGLESVDPHSEIPLHAHDAAEEIVFIVSGEGKGYVGDEAANLTPGTVVFIPPKVAHRFVNTGDSPLWLTWTFSPPGFERRIRKVADGSAGMESL